MKANSKMSPETKEKISNSMKGRTPSVETREKIRASMMGKKNNLGYIFPDEHKKKMSESQKARWEKVICQNSGQQRKTPLKLAIRSCSKYKDWRSFIFERDNFTCVECNSRGVKLNADHFPERFVKIFNDNAISSLEEAYLCDKFWDTNNGRTLCVDCHMKTETYGNYKL